MNKHKKQLIKKAMKAFKKAGGGTAVDPKYTANNPAKMKQQLEASFKRNVRPLLRKIRGED